ncbi:hypothetical protein M8J77_002534 [Diaphorina citri]|nr:hypothetical protein M8J77_002534 [Diaphorina citri]
MMKHEEMYNTTQSHRSTLQSDVNEQNSNLIVNYVPQTMTQEELQHLFSSVGEVESCKLIRDKTTAQSLGYGFVNYYRTEDAERAIIELNGLKLQNKSIKVSYARPSSEAIKRANLYVSGLPKHMTQEDLENLFRPYGTIITSRILCDKMASENVRSFVSGTPEIPQISKGIGFVRFNQHIEAEHAMQELNGTIPEGASEPITVKFANSPAGRAKALAANLNAQAAAMRHFGNPLHHFARFKFAPLTADLLNNSMLPPKSLHGSGWCIFVYNLAPETEDNVLWQLFGPFGAVQNVKVVRDPQTYKCKGFGFVCMTNYDEAVFAIQSLNGYALGDRLLQVSFKTHKPLPPV